MHRKKEQRSNGTYRAHVTRQSLRTQEIYYKHRYRFKIARRSHEPPFYAFVMLSVQVTVPPEGTALDIIIENSLRLILTSITQSHDSGVQWIERSVRRR